MPSPLPTSRLERLTLAGHSFRNALIAMERALMQETATIADLHAAFELHKPPIWAWELIAAEANHWRKNRGRLYAAARRAARHRRERGVPSRPTSDPLDTSPWTDAPSRETAETLALHAASGGTFSMTPEEEAAFRKMNDELLAEEEAKAKAETKTKADPITEPTVIGAEPEQLLPPPRGLLADDEPEPSPTMPASSQ